MANEYRLSYTAADINTRLSKIDSLAEKSEVPKKLSDLTNDSDFVTETYVNTQIGKIDIPDSLADLATDSTHRIVTDAEKAAWNAKSNFSGNYNDLSNKPTIPSISGLATETYVNTQIAAIPTPDVSGQINTHNTATDSHNDIRLLVEGLTNRLNTLANSDDTTLDQMSEIVAYIKNNKSLIEGVTSNKVNVSDIINNLTTNVTNKPLSAAQGVALKTLIDDIVVPTKVSELTNDSGFLSSIPSEYITADNLSDAVDSALAQAKESGEFKGADGKSGVYVGSGDMPEDCNVQIDPNGEFMTMESLAAAITAMLPRYDGEVEYV